MSPTTPFELKSMPGFLVTGIAVRTTNQDGQSNKDIGDLWTRFMSEGIAEQIPGKLSDDTYCVYTDYESDYMGWYTAVLGCRVSEAVVVDGLFTAMIPVGSYRVYQPEGEFPASVANTWMEIWADGVGRVYIADYDLYKAGAKSFEETEAEIYVGIS